MQIPTISLKTTDLTPALILLICLFGSTLYSQINNQQVLQVKKYYDALEYRQAVTFGDSLVSANQELFSEELVFIHKYVGLSRYNLADLNGARSNFFSVLMLNPEMQLSAEEVSPKIISFFNEIKQSMSSWLQTGRGTNAAPRYVLQRDIRPAAAWRSALLPGWGQMHKQQKTRAFVLGGLFWGSVAATLVARSREQDRLTAYEQATGPLEITARYDDYNRWFKTRHFFTYLSIGAWLTAVGDAGLTVQPAIGVGNEPHYGLNLKLRF